jgi:hypothetical protein
MDLWCRWFKPTIVPSLWERLDELAKSGELISTEEVLVEIERKEDGLHAWVNERKDMFHELTDEVQAAVTKIMVEFPKFVDERTGKSFADPFVIATAMVTETIVVTGESYGTPNRPMIPVVCDHYGVKWISTIQLIENEGWQF